MRVKGIFLNIMVTTLFCLILLTEVITLDFGNITTLAVWFIGLVSGALFQTIMHFWRTMTPVIICDKEEE